MARGKPVRQARNVARMTAGIVLVATAVASGDAAAQMDHAAAFERLKSLAGEWEGARSAVGDTTRLSYRTASNGTVVMEILNQGGTDEMINMYHLVDGKLMAAHYCAAGNQPLLGLVAATDRELRFAFAGGSNIDAARDGHIHEVSITFRDDGRLDSRWVWYEGLHPDHDNTFTVARVR